MITMEDQTKLFNLISKSIQQDVECYAFGGTAMMFYGYKDETKDIDILFEKEEQREEFRWVLHLLGYTETSPFKIYIPEKLREKNTPAMYRRDDSRFDLFVKKIFKTLLSPSMAEDVFAVHEFKDKHTFRIKVFRKEHIVMLKAVTERQNDFDDIKKITMRDKNFNWQYLIDETIWQYQHGDSWVLSDVEKMLAELREYIFVEEKYTKQLHDAVQEHAAKGRSPIKS